MSPADPKYPDRVPRRYAEPRRRYASRPLQSTKALTLKLSALAIVITVIVGGLIAVQMAAGNDPSLGPKAVAQAKKTAGANAGSGSSAGTSSGTGSGTDPYSGYGYSYGSGSSGYSSGSSQQYSPPPVTSSTS